MTDSTPKKISEVVTTYNQFGKVYHTKSKDFGEGHYMLVDHPYDGMNENESRFKFVKLPSGHVLFWSSMKNDIVLQEMTLFEYQTEQLKQQHAEEIRSVIEKTTADVCDQKDKEHAEQLKALFAELEDGFFLKEMHENPEAFYEFKQKYCGDGGST